MRGATMPPWSRTRDKRHSGTMESHGREGMRNLVREKTALRGEMPHPWQHKVCCRICGTEHDIQNENTHCVRIADSQKTISFFGVCGTARSSVAV